MGDCAQQRPAAKSWAIVGGGLLGMMLADRLASAGQRVTLFEAAPTLGGLASAWELGDIHWDRHYHVTLLSDLHLRELLADLNLESQMRWVQTRTGFYMDGGLHSMSNLLEFLRFPPLSLLDKLRLGVTIFYASKLKDPVPLEKITAVQWLTRLSGRNVFDKIWLPLLRAKLGENYRLASAAFIWAIIARMYSARRSGLKQEMFGYLPGGYDRLLTAFADKLASKGVTIRCGTAASTVLPARGGVGGGGGGGGGGSKVTVHLGRGRPSEAFDEVILTTPSGVAAKLCPAFGPAQRALLDHLRYQGIVCASVLLSKPLAGYYVTNLIDDWVPYTAVIEMTALVDPTEFGGKHLVYLPKYVDPADPIFDASDDQIRARFVAALLRMYPSLRAEDVLAFQVSRERRVLAIPTLDYSSQLPSMTTDVPGVHVINSAHIVNGTLNVNETLQLAKTAAKRLLETTNDFRIRPVAA